MNENPCPKCGHPTSAGVICSKRGCDCSYYEPATVIKLVSVGEGVATGGTGGSIHPPFKVDAGDVRVIAGVRFEGPIELS